MAVTRATVVAAAAAAHRGGPSALALLLIASGLAAAADTHAASDTPHATGATPPAADATLHYAPNHNFDACGNWRPRAAGFNLADVSDARQLRHLPAGVQGLIWVGLCAGTNREFVARMRPYVGQKRVFGFYLMDDPDPRVGVAQCKPAGLRAEADWIHAHVPGALSFIVLMNLASPATPSYQDTYDPYNSHVDLYGIDPYPCRSELGGGCSPTMIARYVAAAEAWGIARERLIPVYQAFGGGSWRDGDSGEYSLPNPAEVQAMLAQWQALIPTPVFDFAYSWGVQRGDRALENSVDLQAIFLAHNRGSTAAARVPAAPVARCPPSAAVRPPSSR